VAEVESLLCLLVAWNKEVFPEVKLHEMAVRRKATMHEEKRYRSSWLHHQEAYNNIELVTWHKRKEIAMAVVGSYRKQCMKIDQESLLLSKAFHPHFRRQCLAYHAGAVRACH